MQVALSEKRSNVYAVFELKIGSYVYVAGRIFSERRSRCIEIGEKHIFEVFPAVFRILFKLHPCVDFLTDVMHKFHERSGVCVVVLTLHSHTFRTFTHRNVIHLS